MFRTKVLVIGGGPAGSVAARLLAREGVETILIEKNLSFVKPCGGGIPSSGIDEFGIPRDVIRKEIRKITMVSPAGHLIEIELRGGFLAIVKRGEFDSMLRDEAKNSGAQLIEAEFKDLEEKGGHITAKVNIDCREEYIETDYLIAADGVNSRVRFSLGLKLPPALYTTSGKIKGIDADSCEFWFGRSHALMSYSWVFPASDGISVGTGSSEPAALKDFLKKFFERRGLNTGPAVRMYKIPLWCGEVYNKNKILFAGDAAGQVMPLTYEGIYYAMKSGEFAARAVITGRPSEYKKLWKQRFYSRFMIMRRLNAYFLKDDSSAEKMVSLFRRQEIQDVCMKLWLEKSSDRRNLISFINFFRRIIS